MSRRRVDGVATHRDIARGAGAAFLARLGSVIEVVAQPAYVAMFGLATYGLYTVLWAAVNLIENIADLGMTSALQRVVPQAASEEEAVAALRASLILALVPCTLIALACSLGAPLISGAMNVAAADRPQLETAVAIFAWALPLWAIVEVCTSALRARQAFGPEIRLRIVWEQLIRLAIAATLWLAGVSTLGLIVAHLISLSITAGLSIRLLRRYYDLGLLFRMPGRPGVMGDTLLAGLSVLPTNIVSRVFGDAPPVVLNLIIPGAGGAAAAGLYGIARKLSSLVQMVRVALGYVIGPLVSATVRHDRGEVQTLYAYATRMATVLALPIATLLIAGREPVLGLFGPEAQAGAPLIVPLIIARLFDAMTGPGSSIQQVASARHIPLFTSLAALLVAAILAPPLTRTYGATGMAVAVSSGLVVSSLAIVVALWWEGGIHPFPQPFWQVVWRSFVICLGGGALALLVPARPPLPCVGVLIAILLATLWMSLRFALPAADRESLGKMGRKLRLI
ncbi:lipopolysaccharide biosynthesis protein [Sphingomonas sp. ID0503]|uniref:lipopolysaccharide biosynthesis protein n=1 Tax=Sphingomonas sp. ID0503 TaxID=3399691 RepID=UPI003AFB4D6B